MYVCSISTSISYRRAS